MKKLILPVMIAIIAFGATQHAVAGFDGPRFHHCPDAGTSVGLLALSLGGLVLLRKKLK